LITGIPRSGTTLTAALVDCLEDSLCLNEPPRYYTWAARSRDKADFIARCLADLEHMRATLVNGGTVIDRREPDGSAPHNYFGDDGGRRAFEFRAVGRTGSGGRLLLAVKHNEPFTAVLPELCTVNGVRVITIVRHPIPTILSWQFRRIALTSGNLSPGYRFWPEALAIREESKSVCETQVRIFELYCKRYWDYRNHAPVIQYENLIASPSVIECLTGRKHTGADRLATENHKFSDRCASGQIEQLRECMEKYFNYAYRFYPDLETW
jgi:hypothetical protein